MTRRATMTPTRAYRVGDRYSFRHVMLQADYAAEVIRVSKRAVTVRLIDAPEHVTPCRALTRIQADELLSERS